MTKYRLTDTRNAQGLYQIQALKDIPSIGVKTGDLGGWIQTEGNLSQDGNCWVSENGQVSGNGRVFGNGQVSGNMTLSRRAFILDGLSRHAITVADTLVSVGCEVLTINEWLAHAPEIGLKHGYSQKQIAEYLSAFKFIKFMMENYR